MNDNIKRILKFSMIIPVAIVFGTVAGVLLYHMGKAGRIIIVSVIAAIILGVLVFYIARGIRDNKKVSELLDILYKELNIQKYVEDSTEAVEKSRNKAFINTVLMNICVGYEADGDYRRAVRAMREIKLRGASNTDKAIYYNNLAAFYAADGAVDDALATYKMGEKFISKAENKLRMSYINLTRGMIFWLEKKYDKAEEEIKTAKELGFDNKHDLNKAELWLARVYISEGKLQEGKEILMKLLQKKTMPGILKETSEELKKLK